MNKQQLTYRITSAYRVTVLLTLGAAISANVALADDRPDAPSAVSSPLVPAVAPLRTTSKPPAPEFPPMTRSERFRNYLVRIAGPQPFITAAAAAGISQAEDTPKEWRGGAERYGKRIGDAYAQQFIRGTLEYGISAALHEDNRYFKSGQTGFLRRTKYAIVSTLLARHDNGNTYFSFSRMVVLPVPPSFRANGSRAAPPPREMVRLALEFPWAPMSVSTLFVSSGRA